LPEPIDIPALLGSHENPVEPGGKISGNRPEDNILLYGCAWKKWGKKRCNQTGEDAQEQPEPNNLKGCLLDRFCHLALNRFWRLF